MSAVTTSATSRTAPSVAERTRSWLSPLNLHFAGVGLLALLNVYLLVHMGILWKTVSSNDQAALAQQQIALKTAQISAEPLRGLDAKLARATTGSDTFYDDRLPGSVSAVLAELGALTKSHGVRLTRSQDVYAPVLLGSAGELTEMRIDASLSGDYRPLVQFINSLERDKMFFVITGLTLTGQQTGMVNLRLRLTTYVRGNAAQSTGAGDGAGKDNALAAAAPDGGAR